jgi:hypothetical protein
LWALGSILLFLAPGRGTSTFSEYAVRLAIAQ